MTCPCVLPGFRESSGEQTDGRCWELLRQLYCLYL
ncbi:hypothetical protein T06_3956 [Trichinella sp. T6]|nr:hypothetical protein T06_3956 [Trichinella sp. T6]